MTETGQRAAKDSTRCKEASGDDLVRSLHLVPSGIGIVVGILVGEIGAALHQNRTDQHQDEQEGMKYPRLRGQHAADQNWHDGGAEGEGSNRLKPDAERFPHGCASPHYQGVRRYRVKSGWRFSRNDVRPSEASSLV